MNWYFHALNKYAVFDGRASRSEFWYFTLFNYIILVALLLTAKITGYAIIYDLCYIYMMVTMLPYIGVTIRRLHDTGRSGIWLIFGFIPIIGFFIVLALCIKDSDQGTNQYGQNPKTQP